VPAEYLAVFALAAVATFVFTFPLRQLAVRRGHEATPDARRVHQRPTPTSGGIAMLGGFGAAMALAAFFGLGGLHAIVAGSSEVLGVVLAAAAITAFGFIDDVREMSAPAKIAGQIVSAMILYFLGVTMFWVKIPFGSFVLLGSSFVPLVTAIWVIGLANAVNLIDGLDGLAAGIVAIASGALCVYSVHLQSLGALPSSSIGPLVAAATCGICIGFLPHNFHPAKVFMGDAGSMLLGLLMASATMVIGGRASIYSGDTFFFFAPLFVPFFILGVPILDTAFAIVRRTARRSGVAHPDRDHLHHRLMRLGHGHRRAVLILWAWTAALCVFVLYPTFDPKGNALLPIGAAFLAVILYTAFRPLGRGSGGHGDRRTSQARRHGAHRRSPVTTPRPLTKVEPARREARVEWANGRDPE
jgi:UDP-GlcNAc:undecaprenyl-phosphate GlcNAc-1-phosphate transferase